MNNRFSPVKWAYAFTISLLVWTFTTGVASAANKLDLSKCEVTSKVDLGVVTFTFHVTPSNMSANVGVQLYVHRANPESWPEVNAIDTATAATKIFPLYKGLDNVIQFSANVPVGTYDGNYRLLLFSSPDGKYLDFTKQLYDTADDKDHSKGHLAFKILTSQNRIIGPQLEYSEFPQAVQDADGTYTVTIPAKLKYPTGYTTDQNAFWCMAKGDGGFTQVWAPMSDAIASDDPMDHYMQIPLTFQLKGVKPGIWNVNFGVFKVTWGDPLTWTYPGLDFEAGGDAWETKATSMPPRIRYEDHKFVKVSDDGVSPISLYDSPAATSSVKFVRGGNYGNALDYDLRPELNNPGYFVLLGETGCRFIRCLFSPDKYLESPMYQHAVDQVVQNIWQAGEYPLICAQDLPKGDTLARRIAGGQEICQMLATAYKDKPVWIEILNEPQEFGAWSDWKPVAERYVKTVRGIDPNAFVIVPFEFWSKDGRGAAADPITDVRVDLYDGHAYITPKDVQTNFGPATAAGLPVLIGEYGGGAEYLSEMDHAIQALTPSPVAIAPWAFTIKGQDSLPLVESSVGAGIVYTSAGKAIAHDFNTWLIGKKVP